MTTSLIIDREQPAPTRSINTLAGHSWHWIAKQREPWYEAGYYYGLDLKRHLTMTKIKVPLATRVTLQFDFDMRQGRRRDGHNYSGTVCKWFIDGLVMAGVLRDDTVDDLVLIDSTFTIKPQGPLKFRLTIKEIE